MSKEKEMARCSDLNAISNVLGNLLKDTSLLKKYPLNLDDFAEDFYKIIYCAIVNLAGKNIKNIDIVLLQNYLNQTSPVSYIKIKIKRTTDKTLRAIKTKS